MQFCWQWLMSNYTSLRYISKGILPNGEITLFVRLFICQCLSIFNFFNELGSILRWFGCTVFMDLPLNVCRFFYHDCNDFLPSSIYLFKMVRSGNYIWLFGFHNWKGILKHMHFFLGGYLYTLIRFFPISITLYPQKINHLNVQ